jgi:thioredoxin reductase (NADPH)
LRGIELNDVAVIGAGPAGIASAFYLKRAGFEPLVLEKGDIGGLLLNANLVENYPGFPGGISGRALVESFQKQLSRLGIAVTKANVESVFHKEGVFHLIYNENEVLARSVIVATGTKPKKLDIPGENELLQRKLFYEVKDIPQPEKNDTYVIIGGGDAAFDYALNIANEVKSVDIIFRGKHPKCIPLLSERVSAIENIRPHPNIVPRAFEENDGVVTKGISASGEIEFPSDYVMVAAGREPNVDLLPELAVIKINEDGGCETPGLFIAGDVRRKNKRQVGIAVGDGIICAMSVSEFLTGEERK